jgi:type I restriction enzyme S subunit
MNSLMPKIDIRPDHWEIVRDILHKHVPDYEVWAFGSRAKWTAKQYSDLDLAVITAKPLSLDVSASLSDDFSESDLPWKVDIVDWAATQDHFREIIKRDKVVVQKAKGLVMSSNWPIVTVDDIKADGKGSIAIGPFGSRMKSDCYVDTGIPVIRGTNITGGPTFKGDFVYITKEKADSLGSSNVYKNDLVFPHRGSIGEVGIILEDKRYVLSSSLMKLTCDMNKVNPVFMYYFFKSRIGRHELLKNASQVGTPGIGQPLTSLKGIEFRLPPLAKQNEIGDILSSLDKKIDINSETNQTLEQIAQAIFKSWFVDFDPVKAKIKTLASGGSAEDAELAAMSAISAKTLDELNRLKTSNPVAFNKLAQTAALFPKDLDSETGTPAGWNSGVIADIAKLNANSWTKKNRPEQVHYVDLSNTKNGRIETVTTYGFDEAPSRARRILNSGDTIIGTVRPGNRAFAFIGETEKPLTGSTGFAVLSPKEEFWTSFVYLATTNDDAIDEYARLADGGAYPAIKPEVVADTPCVFPTKDIAQKFWQLTGAMLKKAHQARLENEELAKTRDTLLPKLLSGEINVTRSHAPAWECIRS